MDVGARGGLAQGPDPRHQFGQHTLALRILVARVQRAELDRDAVVLAAATPGFARARDGRDGGLVAGQVAPGVGLGAAPPSMS